MSNLNTLRTMYEAYGRGDVESVLSHLADTVEWEYGVIATDVPWLQACRGRQAVKEFFASLDLIEFAEFSPKRFLEAGNVIVVMLDATYTVKRTGRTVVEEDEVHIWHFDPTGRVVRFRHRADTHQVWSAYVAPETLKRVS